MDFRKDNSLSPEEMVSTYERTCAAGLGISLEEAKKRIYACSTTTYQGFQAIMIEQESEKFKDLPGVVFVLPDSYIDPQNKEYGGDKYENGVITHRPPPIHHSRTRPRGNPRFVQQSFQRNTQLGQQPPMQGGGGSYGPPGQINQAAPGGYKPPLPYQAGYNQGLGSAVPPYQRTQGGYGQGGPGNYNQGPQGGYSQGGPRNYSPHGNGNYGPTPGAGNPGYGQGYSGAGQEQNQRNAAGDWNNINPAGQPGSD